MKVEISKNGFVERIRADECNSDYGARVKWITDLAAISRGKHESSNPMVRIKGLESEAEGGKPSRPLEFLPIILRQDDMDSVIRDIEIMHKDNARGVIDKLFKFCHIHKGEFRTNARALVDAGFTTASIPYVDGDYNDFAAFRVKAPMFSWAQIVTHNQLSTESQSDRVSSEQKYWVPHDIIDRISNFLSDDKRRDGVESKSKDGELNISIIIDLAKEVTTNDEFVDIMLNKVSQSEVQDFLKILGYKKEIYSRAPYYFKMKEFVITGWMSDDNAWPHFLRERNAYSDIGGPKNWTQKETAEYAVAFRDLLSDNVIIESEIEKYKKRLLPNAGIMYAAMAKQNELNSHIEGGEWYLKGLDWSTAIFTESAELIESLNWKWWKNGTIDLENAKLEAIDILHFSLSLIYEKAALSSSLKSDKLKDRLTDISTANDFKYDIVEDRDIPEIISAVKLLSSFAVGISIEKSGSIKSSIDDAISLVEANIEIGRKLGMTLEQQLKLYYGKNVLNSFRKDNGYSDGTYTKIWGDKEDNEFMIQYAEALPLDEEFSGKLYSLLSDMYIAVGS